MEIYDRGLRLKELREKRKMTQEKVGECVGVTRTSISSYENNAQIPQVETLERLAILFRVSTDYILGLDHKKYICIDDLTESQQQTVTDVVERLREEFKKEQK